MQLTDSENIKVFNNSSKNFQNITIDFEFGGFFT